ncbi:MAG: hypothetical protein ACYCY0_06580 [Acidithiobacillus ferrivorans]
MNSAQYRYCWRVRFAAPEVINSYHEHPDYVAFTNRRFRPVADREISIGYAMECLENHLRRCHVRYCRPHRARF